MPQRVKRQTKPHDPGGGNLRRKRRRLSGASDDADIHSVSTFCCRTPRHLAEVRAYNKRTSEKPGELIRKDLISAMKLPDSEYMAPEEYFEISDQWKQEWERGVQVPVNPDRLPNANVTFASPCAAPADFKMPKRLIHVTAKDWFDSQIHTFSDIVSRCESICRYDLDQLDLAWMDIFNGERIRMGLPRITENMFENCIENLESQSCQKMHELVKTHEGLSIEYDEDVLCDVCQLADSEEDNEMVFCDKCNICVHQTCYGISVIPDGSWLCRTCYLGIQPDCVLCPNKGGAMKSTRSGQKWAHVSCALWIPEVSIGDVEKMEPITKISNISASRWALTCVLCKQKVGACIQCSVKSCKTAYHVTCAFKFNLKMKPVEDECEQDEIKLKSYCPKHSKSLDEDGKESEELHAERSSLKLHEDQVQTNRTRKQKLAQIESDFHTYVNIKQLVTDCNVDLEAADYIFYYWKMKRMSNHNKPLLPSISELDSIHSSYERKRLEKVKRFIQIRQNLEKARNLCYMVTKRQKQLASYFRLKEQTWSVQHELLKCKASLASLDRKQLSCIVNANRCTDNKYDMLYAHTKANTKCVSLNSAMHELTQASSSRDIYGINKVKHNREYLNGADVKRERIGSVNTGTSHRNVHVPSITKQSLFGHISSEDSDSHSNSNRKKKTNSRTKTSDLSLSNAMRTKAALKSFSSASKGSDNEAISRDVRLRRPEKSKPFPAGGRAGNSRISSISSSLSSLSSSSQSSSSSTENSSDSSSSSSDNESEVCKEENDRTKSCQSKMHSQSQILCRDQSRVTESKAMDQIKERLSNANAGNERKRSIISSHSQQNQTKVISANFTQRPMPLSRKIALGLITENNETSTNRNMPIDLPEQLNRRETNTDSKPNTVIAANVELDSDYSKTKKCKLDVEHLGQSQDDIISNHPCKNDDFHSETCINDPLREPLPGSIDSILCKQNKIDVRRENSLGFISERQNHTIDKIQVNQGTCLSNSERPNYSLDRLLINDRDMKTISENCRPESLDADNLNSKRNVDLRPNKGNLKTVSDNHTHSVAKNDSSVIECSESDRNISKQLFANEKNFNIESERQNTSSGNVIISEKTFRLPQESSYNVSEDLQGNIILGQTSQIPQILTINENEKHKSDPQSSKNCDMPTLVDDETISINKTNSDNFKTSFIDKGKSLFSVSESKEKSQQETMDLVDRLRLQYAQQDEVRLESCDSVDKTEWKPVSESMPITGPVDNMPSLNCIHPPHVSTYAAQSQPIFVSSASNTHLQTLYPTANQHGVPMLSSGDQLLHAMMMQSWTGGDLGEASKKLMEHFMLQSQLSYELQHRRFMEENSNMHILNERNNLLKQLEQEEERKRIHLQEEENRKREEQRIKEEEERMRKEEEIRQEEERRKKKAEEEEMRKKQEQVHLQALMAEQEEQLRRSLMEFSERSKEVIVTSIDQSVNVDTSMSAVYTQPLINNTYSRFDDVLPPYVAQTRTYNSMIPPLTQSSIIPQIEQRTFNTYDSTVVSTPGTISLSSSFPTHVSESLRTSPITSVCVPHEIALSNVSRFSSVSESIPSSLVQLDKSNELLLNDQSRVNQTPVTSQCVDTFITSGSYPFSSPASKDKYLSEKVENLCLKMRNRRESSMKAIEQISKQSTDLTESRSEWRHTNIVTRPNIKRGHKSRGRPRGSRTPARASAVTTPVFSPLVQSSNHLTGTVYDFDANDDIRCQNASIPICQDYPLMNTADIPSSNHLILDAAHIQKPAISTYSLNASISNQERSVSQHGQLQTTTESQLKLKIKGPFMNPTYNNHIVEPETVHTHSHTDERHMLKHTSDDVVNSTLRKRKKELIRQYVNSTETVVHQLLEPENCYQHQQTEIDRQICPNLSQPHSMPNTMASMTGPRTSFNCPKAVKSVSHAPTRDDYLPRVKALGLNSSSQKRRHNRNLSCDIVSGSKKMKSNNGGDTRIIQTPSLSDQVVRPPKKRLESNFSSNFDAYEQVRTESLKYREKIQAHFEDVTDLAENKTRNKKKKKHKHKKSSLRNSLEDESVPSMVTRVINTGRISAPKLIIKLGSRSCKDSQSTDLSGQQETSESTIPSDTPRLIKPLKLKLSRNGVPSIESDIR